MLQSAVVACAAWTLPAILAAGAARNPAGRLIASNQPAWSQWRGPRRDGTCDETGLLKSWPEGGPKLRWTASRLGRGYSSTIIARGMLYITGDVGDQLHIFALDLDGKGKWRVKNGRSWKRSHPGSRASCAYDDGKLYHMNAHGRVVCLDAATGKETWAVNILQRFDGKNIRWGLSECLLIDGPRVIVTPGGKKAMMAALDKKTGKTVWASESLGDDKAGYASPILFALGGRRHLVSFSSRHAFSVDADTGKLLWKRHCPTLYEVLASIPVYHDGAVFIARPDGKDIGMSCLRIGDKGTGVTQVWHSPLNNLTGGVVLVDGFLYGAGYKKNDGWLCVDARTGKVRYEKRDLNSGSVLYADGRLYCLSERGEMALLKPTADGFETLGRFRLVAGCRTDVWPHPVIHNRRLYLRYHRKLYCYDIRAKQ